MDQHQTDQPTQQQSHAQAERRHQQSFPRQHGADLPPCHADVAQHAELAPACQHQRAEAGRQAGQTEQHRHGLQRIGHREGAIENRQRGGADFPRCGDIQCCRPRQVTQGLAQWRKRRTRCQPEAGLAGAGITPQAQPVGARHQQRALLPGVIAPHPGDVELLPGKQRQLQLPAGLPLVALGHRFTGPQRDLVRLRCLLLLQRWKALHHRQHLRHLPGLDIACQQQQRRLLRIDQQALAVQKLHPLQAGQTGHLTLHRRRKKCAVTRATGTQIQIRWQDLIQPVFQRGTKRGHHDGHRYHQRHTGHDGSQAEHGLTRRAGQLLQGQPGRAGDSAWCRRCMLPIANAPLQCAKHQQRQTRHQQNAAHQQQRNGDVTRQRQAVPGRGLRQQRAHTHQQQARPGRCQAQEHSLLATSTQGPRRRCGCRFHGRCNTAQHTHQHAQRKEQQRRPGFDLQLWQQAVEMPGTQIGTEARDQRTGQQIAQQQAQRRTRSAQTQCFEQHQPRQFAPGHAQHPQQGELRPSPHHRQHLRGKHQQATGEQCHQCQHVQIHPVRARQAAHPFGTALRQLQPYPLGQERLHA